MSRLTRTLAILLPLFVFAIASPAVAQESDGVPVLVYHRFGPVVADSMTVTTPVLEEQLAWLRSHGYRIVSLRSLVAALQQPPAPLPSHAVVISVDDGHRSVYTELFPIIERERFPVTLFIYPSAISNANYALTWDQLGEMARSGLIDVESHTYWHPNFDRERARLSADDYRRFVMTQLTRSKAVLERHIGTTVDLLAWPFGIHNAELEQSATAAGYVAAFTLERKHVRSGAPLLALPRYLMTDRDRGARFAALVEGPSPRSSR